MKINDIIKSEHQEFAEDYEKELGVLFTGVKCKFSIVEDSKKLNAIKPNLDFHQNLYEIILRKVTESRMILNIEDICRLLFYKRFRMYQNILIMGNLLPLPL